MPITEVVSSPKTSSTCPQTVLCQTVKPRSTVENHYSWVDIGFLRLIDVLGLQEREIKTYLLYVRHCTPKKNEKGAYEGESISIAGTTASIREFGLRYQELAAARPILVTYGLIRYRSDINWKGNNKLKPVEVLNLPQYKDNKPQAMEYQPRQQKLCVGGHLCIPPLVIDNGKLKRYTVLQLKTLLSLYFYYEWKKGWVDYDYVRKENSEPQTVTIDGNKYVKNPDKWIIYPSFQVEAGGFVNTALNLVVEEGLFKLIPAVLSEEGVVRELEFCSINNRYLIGDIREGERVIWVLRSCYSTGAVYDDRAGGEQDIRGIPGTKLFEVVNVAAINSQETNIDSGFLAYQSECSKFITSRRRVANPNYEQKDKTGIKFLWEAGEHDSNYRDPKAFAACWDWLSGIKGMKNIPLNGEIISKYMQKYFENKKIESIWRVR